MFECPAQLVRTRRSFNATANAIQASNHIVNLLTSHQLADALQVSITPTQKEYLLDDVVLIGSHIYQLRTGAVSLILYMFCLHICSKRIFFITLQYMPQSYE